MDTFQQTLGFVGAVAIGIAALAVFFKSIGWVGRGFSRGPSRLAFKGMLDEKTPVTIHLANNNILSGVRFIGFLDSNSSKGALPWELNGMIVLQHEDGRRTLVQAKTIRQIEAPSIPQG